jgi:hypothetical protein
MTNHQPVALPALARTLLEQVQGFGLLGCHAAPTEDDLKWLAVTVVKPLNLLFEILENATGRTILPLEVPLLYHTAGWPSNAPPAGYAGESTVVRGRDHTASLFAFWTLQLRNESDPAPAAYKLVRAALWIVRVKGLAAALRYLFTLFDAGFVIRPEVASNAIWLLLDGRRRVRVEPDLPGFFLKALPDSPDAWAQTDFRTDFRNVLMAKLHLVKQRDIANELDLLCDLVSERIARAREAADLTEWILGQARLKIAAVATLNVFRWAEVDDDLSYAGFAAQFDEIGADCGAFFLMARSISPLARGDRLSPNWGLAGAMAVIAKDHEPGWINRILDERMLVPDALLATYTENPTEMVTVVSAEWRVPSPKLVPIMARLSIQDDRYAVRTAAPSHLLTENRVKAAAEQLGRPLDDVNIGRLINLFRELWTHRAGSILEKLENNDLEYFSDGYVPRTDLEALVADFGLSKKELEAWLGDLLAKIGQEHVTSSLIDTIKRVETGDRSSAMAELDALLEMYPAFAPLRSERAILLDTDGQSLAAWDEITAALQLQSGNGLVWQSAAVILNRLHFTDDAAAAAATAYVIQQGSDA